VGLSDEDENILQVAPPGEGENNQQPQVQQGVGENNHNAVRPMDKVQNDQAVGSTAANTLKKQHVKKVRITLKRHCSFFDRPSKEVGTHHRGKRTPPGRGKKDAGADDKVCHANSGGIPAKKTVKVRRTRRISICREWHAQWPQLHDVGGDYERWLRLRPGYIGGINLSSSCKRVWVDPVLAALDLQSAFVWCRVWSNPRRMPPMRVNCGWTEAAWMIASSAVRDTEWIKKKHAFTTAIKVLDEEKNKYISLRTYILRDAMKLAEVGRRVSLDKGDKSKFKDVTYIS
jgi:hypothetical protein